MSCQIVLYTHSEYKDLWPIFKDFLSIHLSGFQICIAVNATSDAHILQPFPILFYDDTKTYPSRIVDICNQISSDYIFFFHDIDVVTQFDKEKFHTLMQWIYQEQVDRFSFGMYPSKDYVCMIGDMPIAKVGENICSWFCTPYDVGPSVWKRSTFKQLMETYKEETYRTIEESGIQTDLLTKKVYGFSKKDISPLFCIGRPFTQWFSFCHLLVRGKWVPIEGWQSYSQFFPFLYKQYSIDPEKRGFTDFYIGMQNGLSIS